MTRSLLYLASMPCLLAGCTVPRASWDKKLGRCLDSATCEPLDADIIAASVQNSGSNFPYSLVFLSINLGITGWYNPGRLWRAGSEWSTDLSVVCPFPLFVALCDHNPLIIQTDRRHLRSRSALIRVIDGYKSRTGTIYICETIACSLLHSCKTKTTWCIGRLMLYCTNELRHHPACIYTINDRMSVRTDVIAI